MNKLNQSFFDIMGPVMAGPSSSHSAGVLKIAYMARIIFQEPVEQAHIIFHGSLAYTHKGHGSDRSVIAGLLGMSMDDENINDSPQIAGKVNLHYSITAEYELPEHYHPNTVILILENSSKKMEIRGASTGGGNVEIQEIDGYDVSLTGDFESLAAWHQDEVGVIAKVSQLLAGHRINIAAITSHRREKGEEALLVVLVDTGISSSILKEIGTIPAIYRVLCIPRIFPGVYS